MNLGKAKHQMSIVQVELPLEMRGAAPTPRWSGEAESVRQGDERSGLDDRHLMERIVEAGNLARALKRVRENKGSPGVDGLTVTDLRRATR